MALIGAGYAASAEPVIVAALGDSLTQGYGLPPEDGFVPELEQWLLNNGEDVRILNAGVSGDTTAGGLSRVAWTLTPDVDALIVSLGGNDMLRGIDPAVSRANLDGILSQAVARDLPILLIGLPAAGNYGPDFKSAFDGMFPDLAEKYGTLLVPSFFGALETLQDGTGAVRQRYFQPDGIHPNAEGVVLIVEDVGPSVAQLIDRAQK